MNNPFTLPVNMNGANKKGYFTPPESEVEIPTLPSFDENILRNAPPQLLRGRLKDTSAWLQDSGSVGLPSDILVEHETDSRHYQSLIGDFNNMSILDRPNISSSLGGQTIPEENPFLYSHNSQLGHEMSETGSQNSRRSMYGGCGYSRDYFRNLTAGDYLRPSGLSPAPGSHSPRLLHPTGSPASEASKSPQRSPRSQRGQPMWGFRSFQNPIGTVYHDPESTEWSWSGQPRAGEDATQQQQPQQQPPVSEAKEEERGQWSGRNLLPYETLSGANYPEFWMRPGDTYYVPTRTPPLYTNVRSPQTQLTSLAPFLPRAAPASKTHLYPPTPTMRTGNSKPSSRPYSADVGRLVSVEEDAEVRSHKSHRRSSSYGSTSEMEAQLGYHEHDHLRHGYSYGDIHSDYPPPDDYYFGSHNTLLDQACELLSPDLRPIPPQPNCPQSMQIYEDHRKLAAEFVRMQTEMQELKQYKEQLAEKVRENKKLVDMKTPTLEEVQQYNRLKEEKEALLAFKEKLGEQLALIEEAQNKRGGSAHSSQDSGAGNSGWVMVNTKPPEKNNLD